jgi:restriction system protein
MAVPDYQTLMLPVLRIAAEGELRIGDVVDRLAQEFGLTPEDRSQLLPSGRQTTFSNRVHWAKTYLAKAGLIEITKRAHFRITERGKSLLAKGLDRIDNSVLSQYSEFLEFRTRAPNLLDEPDDAATTHIVSKEETRTPDEVMRAAQSQVNAALGKELLSRILAAPPDFFERLVIALLLAMGYGGTDFQAGKVLGKSGDGGVDGVIAQDPLGLDRVYVQAKRYASEVVVGPSQIRDFFGSLDDFKASKGLFVTTSAFTKTATETAARLSKRIVLIDGNQLAALMIRHNVGCRTEERFEIKRIDEDYFEE